MIFGVPWLLIVTAAIMLIYAFNPFGLVHGKVKDDE